MIRCVIEFDKSSGSSGIEYCQQKLLKTIASETYTAIQGTSRLARDSAADRDAVDRRSKSFSSFLRNSTADCHRRGRPSWRQVQSRAKR